MPPQPQPDMPPPRFLASVRRNTRPPLAQSTSQSSTQSRLSTTKQLATSLFSSTKDYIVSRDYRGAVQAVAGKVKDAVAALSDDVEGYNVHEGEGTLGGVRKKQTWDEWAREKTRRRKEELRHEERVWLFPGWAARRHQKAKDGPFTIELLISGYCTSLRPPEQATRAQRAFMRLARSFSSLPRLPATSASGSTLPSPVLGPTMPGDDFEIDGMDDLMSFSPTGSAPGTPKVILDTPPGLGLASSPLPSPSAEPLSLDYASTPSPATNSANTSTSSTSLSQSQSSYSSLSTAPSIALYPSTPPITGPKPIPIPSSSTSRRPIPTRSPSLPGSSSPTSTTSAGPPPFPQRFAPDELRTLHANLDARLQPFWASALPARRVLLSITLPPPPPAPSTPSTPNPSEVLASLAPPTATPYVLLEEEVVTSAQGYFERRITVPWEKIVEATRAYGGDLNAVRGVEVKAVLLPALSPSPSMNISGTVPSLPPRPTSITLPTSTNSPSQLLPVTVPPSTPTPPLFYSLPLPPPSLRLISDIDDTVKHTAVLSGAKTVFNNVFVRHLDEIVIPGLAKWYREMERSGVGFHYVSNSPFELLPVIRQFFDVANLPPGSMKLKYYSPTAVFHGLWEPAGERKRGGVVEIMDAFPEARFILVGDTGEQDMELYVSLACERPKQVAAIFLRDVTPTAWELESAGSVPPSPRLGPAGRLLRRSATALDLVSRSPSTSVPTSPLASLPSTPLLGPSSSSPSTRTRTPSPARRSATLPVAPPSPLSLPSGSFSLPEPSSVSYFTPAALAPEPPGSASNVKRRDAWRVRLVEARKRVPEGVVFRLFRRPEECVEWVDVVRRYGGA